MTVKTKLKNYGKQQKQCRGKFIAIQSYLKKQEKQQTENLTLHLEELEKEQPPKKLAEGKKS